MGRCRCDDPDKIEISFSGPLVVIHKFEADIRPGSRLTISCGGFSITMEGDAMYTLPVDQQVMMKVSYVDASGNPATVDGDVVWTTSDPAIVTVLVDIEDSAQVMVTPVGPVGQVQVTATADADMGEGTRELVTLCDISIVAGEAVAGTIAPVEATRPIA